MSQKNLHHLIGKVQLFNKCLMAIQRILDILKPHTPSADSKITAICLNPVIANIHIPPFPVGPAVVTLTEKAFQILFIAVQGHLVVTGKVELTPGVVLAKVPGVSKGDEGHC